MSYVYPDPASVLVTFEGDTTYTLPGSAAADGAFGLLGDHISDTLALSALIQTDDEISDTLALASSAEADELYGDGFTLSDAIDHFSVHTISDTLTFADRAQESVNHDVDDTLRLRDSVEATSSQDVSDALVFSDSFTASSGHELSDTLSFTDARQHAATSSAEISDALRLRDGVDTARSDEISDSISFSEVLRHESVQEVSDTLLLAEAVQQTALLPGDEISDTLSFSDAVQAQVVAVHEVSDRFTIADTYFHKDPTAVAWVMNTSTGAPALYTNWQFAAMTQFGDRVFAVGPLGLVEVGADTDDGDLIDAELQYGFSELGGIDNLGNAVSVPERKRVDAFYFGYTAAGELAVTVETYGQGYPLYSYAMPPRPADQPIAQRVTPGKALSARYWRVGVKNVDGCAFDVDAVSVDIIPTGRRL